MSKPTEIETMLIERACERLINEFFEAVDLRNEAHLDNLFTEDATYARPITPDAIIGGREAIRKSFEARPAGRVGRHTCSNARITVESADRAVGVHRVTLFMGPEQSPDPQFGYKADARILVGEFADVFVKTAQGWRFHSRRGRVILHT
ncbi:MAG: nuclear transport factor 2 family protein [Gammaproteobacteria bacterium]